MSRLTKINPHQATGKAKTLLDAVNVKLGLVPNMTRIMANSPAVLEGYLNFSGALAGGALSPKLREQIALVVARSQHLQLLPLGAHRHREACGSCAG